MKKEVCIGVVTHKPYTMPGDKCYLPIWVGRSEGCPNDFCSHGEGDSIAYLNPSYCELTGLYWLWKNVDAKYKGLAHYRRILATKPTGDINDVLKTADYIKVLQDSDVLVSPAKRYPWTTIQKHYIESKRAYRHIHQEDIAALRHAMRKVHPDYCQALDAVLNGRKAHMLNIFCMEDSLFSAYCAWLFEVIDEFYSLRSDRADQKRFAGAISEFLLDVWASNNGLALHEAPLYEPEASGLKKVYGLIFGRC